MKATRRTYQPKIQSNGFWFNPALQQRVSTKAEGCEYWDSDFEFSVAIQLNMEGIEYKRQVKIPILPEIAGFKKREWKCDFYLPQLGKYVELKGDWINNVSCEGERREFKLMLHCLAFNSPTTFSNLYIVHQKPITGIESIDRLELFHNLRRLKLCVG